MLAHACWSCLQDPLLRLLPQVSAPGEQMVTTYGRGKYTTDDYIDAGEWLEPVSGTSYSAPYTAAAIALALQYHRESLANNSRAGIAQLRSNPRARFDQAFVMSALMATGTQVGTSGVHTLETTAKQGAGILNVAGLVFNPVAIKPLFVSLPSSFATHKRTITLTYAPQPTNEAPVRFRFNHSAAAAYVVPPVWGGANTAFAGAVNELAVSVTARPAAVTLSPGQSATVQVRVKRTQAQGRKCTLQGLSQPALR